MVLDKACPTGQKNAIQPLNIRMPMDIYKLNILKTSHTRAKEQNVTWDQTLMNVNLEI